MDKIKSDKFAKKRLTFGIIISIILSFISHFAGILKSFKPIIYLYPLKKGKISLKLKYPERLTCSYPKYENSWEFIADTAGKLIDTKTNKEFYALYWEGKFKSTYNKKEGFCISGNKTAEFLEEKLKILGLNYK